MSDYKLANGHTLTEAEIERRATEWENGTWTGHLVTLRAGRARLSPEPNANISFKCPESGAELIERAAQATGTKKSEFIRNAALEKARQILATS